MVDRRRPGDPAPPAIQRPILQDVVQRGTHRPGRINMPWSRGSRPTPFIPDTDWSGQILPNRANDLASDPPSIQLLSTAQDEVIPVLYGGPEMMAGMLYFYGVYQLRLILCLIYCEGEIEKVGDSGTADGSGDMTGLRIGDRLVTAADNILGNKYRGTNTQDIAFILPYVIPNFDENLRGTAYAVYQYLNTELGVPRLTMPVYGRKIYDPRSNRLLNSNGLGGSGWGGIQANVFKDEVGPYGATNYATRIKDESAAAYGVIYQNIAAAQDTLTRVGSIKVKKQAGPQCLLQLRYFINGVTPHIVANGYLDPNTGATTGSSAGVTAVDLGTFWLLTVPLTNDNTANVDTLQFGIYPDSAALTGVGSNVFCEAQVRMSTKPVGYITTPVGATIDQPTVWNRNTALNLGDYLSSTVYGEGRTVNQDSLGIAAEYCDQVLGIVRTGTYSQSGTTVTVTTSAPHGLTVGWATAFNFTSGAGPDGTYTIVSAPTSVTFTITVGVSQTTSGNVDFWTDLQNENRSTITLLLEEFREKKEWRDLIRSYIPAWVNDDGNETKIRVDTTSTVDHTITDSDIDITDGPPNFGRAGASVTPNVVTVSYTDTTVYPWKTSTATAPDIIPNPARRTRIDMPGMRSYSQAKRYATERLNHYTLEDLTGEIDLFDIGVKILPGDLINLTYTALNIGVGTPKPFRVLGVQDKGHGRWRIRIREYQTNAYSNLIQTSPLIPDITQPNINVIPDVQGLSLSAERYLVSGTYASRIKATWAPETNWPYVSSYFVEMFEPAVSGPTYSITANVVTVTWNGHGQVARMPFYADFTSSSGTIPADGWYSVATVPDANTFTFALTHANVSGNVSIKKWRESGDTINPSWVSKPVLLDTSYTIRVRIKSFYNQLGPIT